MSVSLTDTYIDWYLNRIRAGTTLWYKRHEKERTTTSVRRYDDLKVLARFDNGDGYSMHGIILFHDEGAGTYLLGQVEHCSCYGTWEDDAFNGSFTWEGSKEELLRLARRKRDPSMPSRSITSGDCDYEYLSQIYTWVNENMAEKKE